MSGIERIGPSGPSGPRGAAHTERTRAASSADAAFELRGAQTPSTEPSGAPIADAAVRLRTLIDEGLDRGLGKDEILERVVANGIQRGLGPLASPELEQKVVRAIEQNPAARELFDRLYARAVQARR